MTKRQTYHNKTDNTMTKRWQKDKHNTIRQTIQWPQDDKKTNNVQQMNTERTKVWYLKQWWWPILPIEESELLTTSPIK